jgi:catechol 2,3-dioxygenase-like lactoylglutathione lyase family enzyme
MTPEPLEALRLPMVPIDPRPEFAADLSRRIEAKNEPRAVHGATVRYFVNDLETAVSFYCECLGFEAELRPSPVFAMLYRGDLRLLLSVPGAQRARCSACPVLSMPCPTAPFRSRAAGTGSHFWSPTSPRRSPRCAPKGVTSATTLWADPSGNLIELFEPLAGYHERAPDRTR